MLLLGVSAPVPPPSSLSPAAAVAPNAAPPPKPPASASCSRFFFLEYMANMRAPTMIQAARMPIMINTAELVPPESDADATEPLLADAGFTLLFASPPLDPAAEDDEELLNDPLTDAEKLLDPLIKLEDDVDALLDPDTLEDVDLDEEVEELMMMKTSKTQKNWMK
ncbi:hypothetical protein P3T76_002401 [Phytophthora citrophthora]|uniref:Uncharacterized protein n=1 Tax=Phytophthora citrophthora TaxID=4793 RepID=A0AAD9GYA9_9STRA|nr:hypothetical protein P3T76_002401 [Phytophthora citrophthora]